MSKQLETQIRWNEENSASSDKNNSQPILSNAIIKKGIENIENEISDKLFSKKELKTNKHIGQIIMVHLKMDII